MSSLIRILVGIGVGTLIDLGAAVAGVRGDAIEFVAVQARTG